MPHIRSEDDLPFAQLDEKVETLRSTWLSNGVESNERPLSNRYGKSDHQRKEAS